MMPPPPRSPLFPYTTLFRSDLAVTRWQEDPTRDGWGTFCYLRDVASGEFWSTAHQPTLKRATKYEAIYSQGRSEEHTSELQSQSNLVCRLLLEKKTPKLRAP